MFVIDWLESEFEKFELYIFYISNRIAWYNDFIILEKKPIIPPSLKDVKIPPQFSEGDKLKHPELFVDISEKRFIRYWRNPELEKPYSSFDEFKNDTYTFNKTVELYKEYKKLKETY